MTTVSHMLNETRFVRRRRWLLNTCCVCFVYCGYCFWRTLVDHPADRRKE
ncbi:hypothetical protein [Kribbella sp. VKM Ac-2500]